MAEIYGVFDWRALPLRTAATLAAGLGPGSRCEGARWGLRVPLRDFLTARIADRLALFLRHVTQSDDNPRLISNEMLCSEKNAAEEENAGFFETAEDFEAWREKQFYTSSGADVPPSPQGEGT